MSFLILASLVVIFVILLQFQLLRLCLATPLFFFSSRRRHTRCALVTGVQTCALPISAIPRRPSLRQFPPQAPMRQVDAPARIDDYQAAWRRKASGCGSVGHNGATVGCFLLARLVRR